MGSPATVRTAVTPLSHNGQNVTSNGPPNSSLTTSCQFNTRNGYARASPSRSTPITRSSARSRGSFVTSSLPTPSRASISTPDQSFPNAGCVIAGMASSGAPRPNSPSGTGRSTPATVSTGPDTAAGVAGSGSVAVGVAVVCSVVAPSSVRPAQPATVASEASEAATRSRRFTLPVQPRWGVSPRGAGSHSHTTPTG